MAHHPPPVRVPPLLLVLSLAACVPEHVPVDTEDTSSDSGPAEDEDTAQDGQVLPVCINEIMADDILLTDNSTETDWIEIHNATDADMDLTGWSVTDDNSHSGKFTFPAGFLVPARGQVLLLSDPGDTPYPNLPFRLDADGESLALTNTAGETVDQLTYGYQREGRSFARFPDCMTNSWQEDASETPGESNGTEP